MTRTAVTAVAPLRLGFAGVGWIGRHRLRAVQDAGVATAAALCDPDPAAIAQGRELAPTAVVAADFDELLAQRLDGVVIATPNALHLAQSLRALERGIPVFCQKPLARSAAEARQVVAAARAANVPLGIDLCYRHLAGMAAVRDAIGRGELGRVFAAEGTFHNAYGPDKAWFQDPAQAGGGCFLDLGIHLVDLLLWLLHGPEVTAVRRRLFQQGQVLPARPEVVEDYAEVQLEFAGGAVARLATSWHAPAGRDAVIALALYGTRGGARLHNVGGSFHDFEVERTDGTRRELLGVPPDAWGGRAITAWARGVAAGDGFDPAVADYLATARVVDEVYDR